MKQRAFTLVEILVVVGIIVLIAAIGLPMLGKAMRSAKKAKTAADLQAIGTALEAYKHDFGDYPRVQMVVNRPTAQYPSPAPFLSAADRPNPRTGAQVLCQALLGLAPATEPAGYPVGSPYGSVVPLVHVKQDGKDGPGWRGRAGGKAWGPYIAPEKIAVGYEGATPPIEEPLLRVFVDGEGNPILYFPKAPIQTPYIGRSTDDREPFAFDATDNFEMFRRTGEPDATVMQRIAMSFGDKDNDGLIENGEKGREQPYVLWTAGADGLYGPDSASDLERYDDVTNAQ